MMQSRFWLGLPLVCLMALPLVAQTVEFGDDSSQYSQDGECDDSRFLGKGMAASINEENILRDAADCSALFAAGQIREIRTKAQSRVSECSAIDFGDDTSAWANDGECDDPRFAGEDTDEILLPEDELKDAADCRALCLSGDVWLR